MKKKVMNFCNQKHNIFHFDVSKIENGSLCGDISIQFN
jgi:hypothetical protein